MKRSLLLLTFIGILAIAQAAIGDELRPARQTQTNTLIGELETRSVFCRLNQIFFGSAAKSIGVQTAQSHL